MGPKMYQKNKNVKKSSFVIKYKREKVKGEPIGWGVARQVMSLAACVPPDLIWNVLETFAFYSINQFVKLYFKCLS